MKASNPSTSKAGRVTRRTFLRSGAIVTTVMAAPALSTRLQANKNSQLQIFQIGVGGIGGLQRNNLKNHKRSRFVGFCDVDQQELDKMGADYPDAWKCQDYREAFANRADEFDAVIVDTPDFHHAPMMLTAMAHGKHMYGQKPLVHQLDELRMIREGLAERPDLVTQMGNQRACLTGRMQAVEMLRRNQLGRPVEAYVWTGGITRGHYFADPWSDMPEAKPVPSYLNWDLWRGPIAREMGYHEDLAPRRWRAFWETGGGQLADWGCHLLDILFFAYDLASPQSVITHTPRPSNDGHSSHNLSTLTFPGGGDRFARDTFVVHYHDSGLLPSFSALGLPPTKVGANHTMIVCEEGTLLLQANGGMTVFRKGKVVDNEAKPEVAPRHHWEDWADNCLGDKKPLWTPFQIGVRITEPALLAVKATRYPGQELLWDASQHRFTNHDMANEAILKRSYRQGFAPPGLG